MSSDQYQVTATTYLDPDEHPEQEVAWDLLRRMIRDAVATVHRLHSVRVEVDCSHEDLTEVPRGGFDEDPLESAMASSLVGNPDYDWLWAEARRLAVSYEAVRDRWLNTADSYMQQARELREAQEQVTRLARQRDVLTEQVAALSRQVSAVHTTPVDLEAMGLWETAQRELGLHPDTAAEMWPDGAIVLDKDRATEIGIPGFIDASAEPQAEDQAAKVRSAAPHLWEPTKPIDLPPGSWFAPADESQFAFEAWGEFVEWWGNQPRLFAVTWEWLRPNDEDWYNPAEDHASVTIHAIEVTRGLLFSVSVRVTDADEARVAAWLRPHAARMSAMWLPVGSAAPVPYETNEETP